MEGFDLSRSLHNAFAPVDNDAYKWQRIYDTRLAWQMQNERTKNELKKLRISDASKLLTGLGNLDYNIMPGPDQEYVQSVLAPLKDAVNEIHGGLMSGQDSEYYLEEAGKIFSIANNILNNDPRIKKSIAVSNLLQSDIANMQKELGNKDKYNIDASRQFQEYVNALNNKYSKGEITSDQFLSGVRSFDVRDLYTLSDLIEEGKNMKVDSITRQNDPLVGMGFQTVNKRVNDDKVFSLLRKAIERVGGSMADITRFVDDKGNSITVQQYNAIKDNKEKEKYKLTYITNAVHCGDNKKCANVIGSIIPVIPGIEFEQKYNKLGETKIEVDAHKEKATFDNELKKDNDQYDSNVKMAIENIKGLNQRLKGGLPPEEVAQINAEKKFWNDYIQNLRKPTNELIISDQGVEKAQNAEEAAFSGTGGNPNSKNRMNDILGKPFKDIVNQSIDKNATKETVENAIANLFIDFGKGNNKITSVKDGKVTLNKDYIDKIHNLVDRFLTPDKLKLYKDKGYSYKAIYDDLIANVKKGLLAKTIRDLAGAFMENGKEFDDDELSELFSDYVNKATNAFEKEDTGIVQISRFNQANPKVQTELTDFVKKNDNTIISEKDGDKIDISQIQNIEGIDYIGDKMYFRANIIDKDNKAKQVKLSIDSKSEETIFDEARRIMNAGDANNPVLSAAHPNYNRNNALSNTNYRTFKNISYANGFVNDLQRINRLSANKRKTLKLMSQDNPTGEKNGNVTIEYTEGSMPMEISYNVNETDNAIKDLVKIRYFTYNKEGHKVYFNNGIYVNLLENKDNFDKILSHTHDSIKNLEDLRRKWAKEEEEEKNKNGNKSNSQ